MRPARLCQAVPPRRAERGDPDPVWKCDAKKERTALGLRQSAAPWTGPKGVQLRGFQGLPREKEFIDCAWAKACAQANRLSLIHISEPTRLALI
eukprot:13754412-Alexandrium_andersonii.AAC.1